MGYFLTTEPKNAVPGKSCASPKTHTPGSRLQERGRRFYSPELGRWTARDPLSDHACLLFEMKDIPDDAKNRLYLASLYPVYLHCGNNAFYYLDADGKMVVVIAEISAAIILTAAVLNPTVRNALSQLISDVGILLQNKINDLKPKCPNPCCRVGWHQAHHPFPLIGKKCHLQVTCWLKGVDNSDVAVRFPVDTCPPFGININLPEVCARN